MYRSVTYTAAYASFLLCSNVVIVVNILQLFLNMSALRLMCCVLHYSVHSELRLESQRRVEQIENIEKQSIHKYFAEVPSDMPCSPPNTELSQKAGYLFMRV